MLWWQPAIVILEAGPRLAFKSLSITSSTVKSDKKLKEVIDGDPHVSILIRTGMLSNLLLYLLVRFMRRSCR